VAGGQWCHLSYYIILERWLSNYKILYRYEVGIPVLKGAGDNASPTRVMVDLELHEQDGKHIGDFEGKCPLS